MSQKTFRCSSLPRLWQCPPSFKKENEETDSEPARMGSAVHWALGNLALNMENEDCLEEIYERYDVNLDELSKLYNFGRKQWREHFEKYFKNPTVEQELKCVIYGVELTGHADVISPPDVSGTTYVLDWKSGWLQSNHEQQLKGYAYLAANLFAGEVKKVVVITVWLRYFQAEVDEISIYQIADWGDEFVAKVKKTETADYRYGEHCQFCPMRFECPKTREIITSGEKAFEIDFKKFRNDPDLYSDTLTKIQIIESAIKAFKDAEKLEVAQGGAIKLPDGKERRINEIVKKEIDAAKALPLFNQWFPEGFSDAIKIKNKEIEKLAAKIPGYKTKKEGIGKFWESLYNHGLVTEKLEARIETRRGKR